MLASSVGQRLAVYLGDHVVLTTNFNGQRMLVDSRDRSLAPHLIIDGYWESWVTRTFLDCVKPGMTVVDVGANFGYYAVLAGAAVGATGRVVAFEPNPKIYRLLVHNLSLNGLLSTGVAECRAAFDQTGHQPFTGFHHHQGSSGLGLFDAQLATRLGDETHCFEVETVRLDEYLHDTRRVDLVKIDVEGAEPQVFRGMEQLLIENSGITVLCEFTPWQVARLGGSAERFLEDIERLGFKLRVIRHDASLEDVTPAALMERDQCELLLRRT